MTAQRDGAWQAFRESWVDAQIWAALIFLALGIYVYACRPGVFATPEPPACIAELCG